MADKKNKLQPDQIFAVLRERFADLIQEEQPKARQPHIVLATEPAQKDERFLELMTFCRDDERLRFDMLSLISAIDYPDPNAANGGRIEVVYCLDSLVHNHWLVVKVPLPRNAPEIASVENIWRTADWHERESFDLVGVIFRGHHNLVRILCAEDWEGHPLRKDYVIPDVYNGIKNVIY